MNMNMDMNMGVNLDIKKAKAYRKLNVLTKALTKEVIVHNIAIFFCVLSALCMICVEALAAFGVISETKSTIAFVAALAVLVISSCVSKRYKSKKVESGN